MMGTLLGSTCLMSMLLVISAGQTSKEPPPRELPGDWRLEDIEKACLSGGKGDAYVLAWKVHRSEDEKRIQECLVLMKIENSGGPAKWRLEHRSRSGAGEWELVTWHEARKKPLAGRWRDAYVTFRDKPSNKKVYDSLQDVHWTFDLEKGQMVISCGICERTWGLAIGEGPTHFFSNSR